MLGMVDRWAVVAKVIEEMKNQGGWAGETHVQKTVFFLQKMMGIPTFYKFVLYKHGPYSFELHDDLGAMRAHLVIDISPRGRYGPSFELGELGLSVIEQGTEHVSRYREQLQFMVGHVGTHDIRILERYSTALYVRSSYPDADEVWVRDKITELKPHISAEDALEAVSAVNAIQMSARQAGLLEAEASS